MTEMDPEARNAIIASFFIIVNASLTQADGVPPVARPGQTRARCTLPPPTKVKLGRSRGLSSDSRA